MTPTEINKKFAELAGICWHEFYGESDSRYGYCRHCLKHHSVLDINFDYCADPRLVLEVFDKREDGKLFYAKLIYAGDNVEARDDDGYISRYYMTNKEGLLALAGIAYLEEKP
jgi:hypothetical protein